MRRRAQHVVEGVRLAARPVVEVLQDVVERDAGNEDGAGPVVDAAVWNRWFRRAGRERGDAHHGDLPATDRGPPARCQLERIVHEERVGRDRPLVADIDLALVLLPGGDRCGGQLRHGDVGVRAGRGAEGHGEGHDGGDGRRRETFVRFEHQSLARHEVDYRAHGNGHGVRRYRVHREPGAEDGHDTEVTGERHGSVQQVKPHEPAGRVARRRARPIAPRPMLVPNEIVQHGYLDCNGCRDQVEQPEPVGQERHQAELDADAQESHAVEDEPAPREGHGSHAL